jgi:hypothetical protein
VGRLKGRVIKSVAKAFKFVAERGKACICYCFGFNQELNFPFLSKNLIFVNQALNQKNHKNDSSRSSIAEGTKAKGN